MTDEALTALSMSPVRFGEGPLEIREKLKFM